LRLRLGPLLLLLLLRCMLWRRLGLLLLCLPQQLTQLSSHMWRQA
jgi:hypothetical protein